MAHNNVLEGEISNVIEKKVFSYQFIDNFRSVVCCDEFYDYIKIK